MNFNEMNEKIGPFIRIGLTAPVISQFLGGSLAQIYTEWDSSRRFKKIESFLKEIKDKLTRIETKRITKQFDDIDCEILDLVLQKIQVEHSEKKRKYYATFLVNALSFGNGFDKKRCFIRAIDDFNDMHFQVLAYLESINQDVFPDIKEIKKFLKINNIKAELLPVLSDLCGKYAFIDRSWTLRPKTAFQPLGNTNLSPENLAMNCQHKITDLGREFYQFITQDSIAMT